MKYSLCGLGGWMGKLEAGNGMGRGKWGVENCLAQAVGSAPAQIRIALGKWGTRNFGQGWARIRCSLMGAGLCTHCTLFVHCTLGPKFPKIPSSICAGLIFHQAQTKT